MTTRSPSLHVNNPLKKRIIGLDYLRVFFALFIFCFHSRIHLHCDYGCLNSFFDSPSIGMSGFFMLSGYCLWLAHGNNNFTQEWLVVFFKKRFVSIYPLYFVMGLSSVILQITAGIQSISDNLKLFPIELFGIQSFFDGALFSYAHNAGTWFVSCIFVCYFAFPLLKELLNCLSIRIIKFLAIGSLILLSYIQLLPNWFDCGNLYTNPFLRIIEFLLGVMLARISLEMYMAKKSRYYVFVLCILLLVIGCSYFNSINKRSDLIIYTCLGLFFLLMSKSESPGHTIVNKVILYLSNLAYSFFLSQLFVWQILKWINRHVVQMNSITLIIVSLAMCLVVSVLSHELIEVRFGRIIKNKLLSV